MNLVKSAGVELAPHGIRVNAAAPGIVLTDRLAATLFQDPKYRSGQLANVPMGRLGAVEDIAGALVFLVSGLAAYVTGTTLQVDLYLRRPGKRRWSGVVAESSQALAVGV